MYEFGAVMVGIVTAGVGLYYQEGIRECFREKWSEFRREHFPDYLEEIKYMI
jgi:hypothetical protein